MGGTQSTGSSYCILIKMLLERACSAAGVCSVKCQSEGEGGGAVQGSPHQRMSAALEMRSEEVLESVQGMKRCLSNQEVQSLNEHQQPSFASDIFRNTICWEILSHTEEIHFSTLSMAKTSSVGR